MKSLENTNFVTDFNIDIRSWVEHLNTVKWKTLDNYDININLDNFDENEKFEPHKEYFNKKQAYTFSKLYSFGDENSVNNIKNRFCAEKNNLCNSELPTSNNVMFCDEDSIINNIQMNSVKFVNLKNDIDIYKIL